MSIKIKANKLIKRIEALKTYRNLNIDDPFDHGYIRAADTIICFIEDMQAKAERKHKKKKIPVTKLQDTIVTELCPYCDTEVGISWDVDKDGFKVFCPNCGEQLMLCSACKDREGLCDWNDEAQACHRCREQTDCERCVFAVECGDGESWHYECRHPDVNEVKIINTVGNCELFEPNA